MGDEESSTDKPEGRRITVRFVDAGTGSLIGRSRVATAELPPVIRPQQTVILSNTTWRVAQAEPTSAKEFEDTGELTLHIVPPELPSLLSESFIVPYATRSETVPALAQGTTKAGKTVLEMNEEDWRQVELVSATQQASIALCFSNIKRIYAEHKTKRGFTKAHLRHEVLEPLYGMNVRVAEVYQLFGEDAAPYAGICFERFAALISGGFGLETNSAIKLYGQQESGVVKALCLGDSYPSGGYRRHVDALARFAVTHGLALVDWAQTIYVPPDVDAFRGYFG